MRRLQLLDSKHSAHFWAQTASGSAAVAPQRAGPAAPGSAPQTHQVLVLAVSDGPSCCCCFVVPKTNWLPPPPTYTPPDPPSLLLPFSPSSPPAPPHVLNLLLLPPVPSPSASSMSLMVLVLILVAWSAAVVALIQGLDGSRSHCVARQRLSHWPNWFRLVAVGPLVSQVQTGHVVTLFA